MLNIYKTKAAKKCADEAVHNPRGTQTNLHVNKHFLLVGPTGSGKSNALVNIIYSMYDCFKSVHIFTLDKDEPIYRMLKEQLREDLVFGDIAHIPSVKDTEAWSGQGERLVVFDDFLSQGKHTMARLAEYAISARKHKMTCVFLSQTFFGVPTTVRTQCRYLCLLKMVDSTNLARICATLGIQLERTLIKKIIANATKLPLHVCLIDLNEENLNRKFRRNMGTDFYTVLDAEGEEIPEDQVVMFKNSGIVN